MTSPYKIQSIGRAVQILDVIVESPRPLTLGEITLAIGLPKSTTHRFLRVMESYGLLELSARKLWRLGPKFEVWGEVRALSGGAA